MKDQGNWSANQYNGKSQKVQNKASSFEGRKETGTYLQPDWENKEYQTEFPYEIDNLRVGWESKMPQSDTGKQYKCDPERHTIDPDFAKYYSGRNYNAIDQYRMSNRVAEKKILYPVHYWQMSEVKVTEIILNNHVV